MSVLLVLLGSIPRTSLAGLPFALQAHFPRFSGERPARSQAKLNFHFNASLSAVTLVKLDARQQHGAAASAFSMASLKWRAFHQHLIERIVQHVAEGHSLEKSSPDYEALCNYGIITETAA